MNKVIYIPLIVLIISSCSLQKNTQQTTVFSSYLKDIERKIPEENHLYILAPKLACSPCVHQLAAILDKKIESLSKERITIITSNSELFSDKVVSKLDYYFDKDKDLDYVNLDLFNITLIETTKGHINDIIHLEINQEDKFISHLKKYEINEIKN